MQIAISGHWSQSMGAELSGQHGMSADISAAIGAALAAFAGVENGANTSPAIKKIASRRPRCIEMFTARILSRSSCNGNLGWITNSPEFGTGWLDLAQWSIISGSWRAPISQSVVACSENVQGG